MKNKILLAGLVALAACTPAHDDLAQWMTKTRKDAKSHVIPFEPPVVTPPKPYIQPPFSGLHAFSSGRLNTIQPGGVNAPDANRPKETLEAFSLDTLKYVGTLRNGNKISGYVEAENHVYTVSPGNYLGQNHGRIQSITPDKIILTELVEDSSGNWTYRQAELPLSSAADKTDAAANQTK